MQEELIATEAASGATLWIYLFSVIVLVFLSALFSAGETAMTAASRARMAMLEKEGIKGAVLVNKLRLDKDRFIGAMLLGNNLLNILASALATSVLMGLFGASGVIYATAIMTVVVLVFAEVLPKSYAFQHADSLAMRLAPFVYVCVIVLAPVVDQVTKTVRFVLRVFGINPREQSLDEQVEELRGAIELHQAPSQDVTEQRAMLRSILDLADVTVDEIMTHRGNVVFLDADMPAGELAKVVFNSPYSRFPVYRGDPDNIIGTIHVKTLMEAWSRTKDGSDQIALDGLLTEAWFVPDTTTLFDQLQAFRQRQEHIALVVDEYAALLGIVALEDILEEIVGDITDEKENHVPGVKPQPDGSLVVDGTVTIRDLNREFEWSLPNEDYSTVAGLILHESKLIPTVGQMFTFFGFRFKILKRQRHQITLVRIYPPQAAA